MFGPCLNRLEELCIFSIPDVNPNGIVLPSESTRLKSASLSCENFMGIFNSGLLNSITSLKLDNINIYDFCDRNTFHTTLNNLPRMLSQLPCLYDLVMKITDHVSPDHDLAKLPEVHSTSLRSLNIDACNFNDNLTFLKLFSGSGCRIECITASEYLFHHLEEQFGNIRHFIAKVSSILLQKRP